MKGAYQPRCLADDYQTNKEGFHMSFSSAVRELSQLSYQYFIRNVTLVKKAFCKSKQMLLSV